MDLPSYLTQPKNQAKYITQQFLDTGHQVTQDSDPWEKENKWAKTASCPSLLQGEGFQAAG